MANNIVPVPKPANEPILSYGPGSPEKAEIKAKLKQMLSEEIEIPLLIGGKEVRTGNTAKALCPHDHKHALATYHQAGAKEVEMAIAASQKAWKEWSEMPWESRAAIFLKAAELLAGPMRASANAATNAKRASPSGPLKLSPSLTEINSTFNSLNSLRMLTA